MCCLIGLRLRSGRLELLILACRALIIDVSCRSWCWSMRGWHLLHHRSLSSRPIKFSACYWTTLSISDMCRSLMVVWTAIHLWLHHIHLWFLHTISVRNVLRLLATNSIAITLLVSHRIGRALLLLLIWIEHHWSCCWSLAWRCFNYLLLALSLWHHLLLLLRWYVVRLRLFTRWCCLHQELLLLLLLICSLSALPRIPARTSRLLWRLHLMLPLHISTSAATLSWLISRLLLQLLIASSRVSALSSWKWRWSRSLLATIS